MFSAYLLLVAVVLNYQIATLPVASAAVKRSVLEESIITLLKEEEQNNREFKATILNTIQTDLKDIRDVISLNVSKLIQNGRYQNEKTLSSLDFILSKLYCPSEFRYIEHSCFKLSNVTVDWESAKRKCQDENSRVASVDSHRFKSLVGEELLKNDVTIWTSKKESGKDMGSVLNSSLLSADDVELLRTWLPGKAFKLLYKASSDGMTAAKFHSKCDNKGPTISIGVDSVTGTVFGGYASVSWSKGVGHQPVDSNAFVFQLCRVACTTTKYSPMNAGEAVIHNAGRGPSFGKNGMDLTFFSQTTWYNWHEKNFPSNGHCQKVTYDGMLNCGFDIKWSDVEVWSVTDGPADCFAFNFGSQTMEDKSCSDEARYVCEL